MIHEQGDEGCGQVKAPAMFEEMLRKVEGEGIRAMWHEYQEQGVTLFVCSSTYRLLLDGTRLIRRDRKRQVCLRIGVTIVTQNGYSFLCLTAYE